jgi:hypothetical protein
MPILIDTRVRHPTVSLSGWSARYRILVLYWSCVPLLAPQVERREEPDKGQGVVWDIYNYLYAQKVANEKLVPVLFEGASPEDIPLPLKAFT